VSNPANNFSFSRLTGFTQSETSTAWCGNNVVVGFNDSGSFPESVAGGGGSTIGFSFNGVARSTDQGQTFQDLGFLNPGSDTSNFLLGDPVLGCMDSSTFYYGSLLQTGFFPNIFSAISVSKSTDGGATFGNPVVGASKPIFDPVTFQFLHFLDKPWMSVDPTNSNRIFVTYTDFDSSGSVCGSGIPRAAIELVRSTDGGATWSATPLVIEEVCGFAPFVQGSQIAVGSSGEVYVAWENYSDFFTREIRIRKSTNNGDSFAPFVKVTDVTCVGDCFAIQGVIRSFIDLGALAVDRSSTSTNGNLYISWHDGRNLQVPDFVSGVYGFADVLVTRSTNGGSTWSAPVRVNSNPDPVPGGGGTDQYQAQAAVDQTGKIAVCFYDRRRDPQNFLIDRFCATSTDAGNTWTNSRQSSPSWAPWKALDEFINPAYLGDYDVVASDFTKSTPAFIGAFQMISARGGLSGNSLLVPNSDVFATSFK
jgi:hypothetical protein